MTVSALIIRPGTSELDAIEVTADPGGSTHLAALRSALDARMVDVIRLEGDRGIDCWLDDEFLYTQPDLNLTATNILRTFGVDFGSGSVNGSIVFTGHDGRGGMVSLTNDQVRVLRDALRQAVYM